MITRYALWGLGIAIFAAIFSFTAIRENRRMAKHKRDLRELPKLFDLDQEENKMTKK
jgi:hypothetical protein